MHGNNTMTKEAFARAQAHPRKVELARILLGTEEDKKKAAIESGFNETIIQEMARDISTHVEGMQSFAIDLQNGAKPAAPVEGQEGDTPEAPVDNNQSNETANQNENQVPTEGTDTVDQTTPAQDQVVDQTQNAPVEGQDLQQGAPNKTEPQS